jgi:dipeptidyl aminopeptidase/acylaminoacyl peptidase
MGLITTPELYRCGISYAGVTDVADIVKRGENKSRAPDLSLLFEARIGDWKADAERLKETSPLSHADQINVPLFLAYGKLDPRVPFGEGRDLARELKRKGKQFVMMVKDDEGHGFHKEENRIEFYTKLEEFLKENLK